MTNYKLELTDEELVTLIKACYNSCKLLEEQGAGFTKLHEMTMNLHFELIDIKKGGYNNAKEWAKKWT